DLAQAYLERDNLMAVFEQTKFVLERKPDDSRALAFGGLVRMSMGDMAAAQTMIEKSTQVDPKNLDGWVALAWINVQKGDMKAAEGNIAAAAKASPNEKARLEEVFAQMKTHANDATTQPAQTAAAGGPLPPGH